MATTHSDPLSSSFPLPTPPPFTLPITPDSISRRHYRRRTQSFCSSSSLSSPTSFSSFSSLSSAASYLSSPSTCPSPSPSTLSSVPFSWEDQPGIPKTKDSKTTDEPAGIRKAYPTTANRSNNGKLEPFLPPFNPTLRPPPSRSCSDNSGIPASFRWRRRLGLLDPGYVRDPFTVALIQCAKQKNASEELDGGADEDDGDLDSASRKLLPLLDTQQRSRRRQPARKLTSGGAGITGNKLYGSCKTSCAVIESAAVLIPRLARPGSTKSYDLLRRRPNPTM